MRQEFSVAADSIRYTSGNKTSQLKMATDNKILQIAGPIEHILNAIGLALEAALTASDPKPVAYLA